MPGSYLLFLLSLTKQKLSQTRRTQSLTTNLSCPRGEKTFCRPGAPGALELGGHSSPTSRDSRMHPLGLSEVHTARTALAVPSGWQRGCRGFAEERWRPTLPGTAGSSQFCHGHSSEAGGTSGKVYLRKGKTPHGGEG